ncbi:hypothetical protein ACIA8H_35225 [Streptomyces goshikiensis]
MSQGSVVAHLAGGLTALKCLALGSEVVEELEQDLDRALLLLGRQV